MIAKLKTSKWKQCGQRKVKSKHFFSEANILKTKIKICKQTASTQIFEICTEAFMNLRWDIKQEVTW
jgi:hypothetical protein